MFYLCIILILFLSLCIYLLKNSNEINTNINTFNQLPNKVIDKYYYLLVSESYNPNPNIDYMLLCLKNIHNSSVSNIFYIIDSIRLFSKSIRSQEFTKLLNKNYGDITYYYYQMVFYISRIKELNKSYKVNNICEIGFQVGAGALTLLLSLKNNLTYYGFDYGSNYSRMSYKLISKYFKMNMEWGKSEETVKKYRKINCDIIHIDGDHSQMAIYNDIKNMKRLSNSHSLLLLDDVNLNSNCIIRSIKEKIINNVKCFNWKPFCICSYRT